MLFTIVLHNQLTASRLVHRPMRRRVLLVADVVRIGAHALVAHSQLNWNAAREDKRKRPPLREADVVHDRATQSADGEPPSAPSYAPASASRRRCSTDWCARPRCTQPAQLERGARRQKKKASLAGGRCCSRSCYTIS